MKWEDELNERLTEQINTAFKLDIRIPELTKLETLEEMNSALLDPDLTIKENYAFSKVSGVRVGFAAYFNGEKFVNYVGMIRDNYQFAGSQGLELDDNMLMIYGMDRKISAKYFKRLASMIKEKSPEYKGFCQLNVFVDKDNIWWYDSIIMGAQPDFLLNFRNLVGNDGFDYEKPQFFSNRYAGSIRLFPMSWNEMSIAAAEEVLFISDIWDVFAIDDGTFIANNCGSNIKDMWKKVYHDCSGIERFNYLYRVDGAEVCKKRFHEIKVACLV